MKSISQFTFGLILGAALLIVIGAAPDPTVSHFPAISLNSKTNVISDSGSGITFNGIPVTSGSSTNYWTFDGTTLSPSSGTNGVSISTPDQAPALQLNVNGTNWLYGYVDGTTANLLVQGLQGNGVVFIRGSDAQGGSLVMVDDGVQGELTLQPGAAADNLFVSTKTITDPSVSLVTIQNGPVTNVFNVFANGSIQTLDPAGGTKSPMKIGLNGSVPRLDLNGTGFNLLTGNSAVIDTGQSFAPVGGFSGSYLTNIVLTNLSAGVHDILTMPVGYNGFCIGAIPYNATNLLSISIAAYLKDSGTYYKLTGNIGAATNSPASASSLAAAKIFKPGQSYALSNAIDGMSFYGVFKMFPTNCPLKQSSIFSIGTTPALLYTVPVSTWALPITQSQIGTGFFGSLIIANDSGASRVVDVYVVASGSSADNSTRAFRATVANASQTVFTTVPMAPGTSVYIDSDAATATQSASMTVYEYTP